MIAESRRALAAALAAALLAGLAAAWIVSDYARSLERRDGAPVTILVSTAALKRGVPLEIGMLDRAVAQRRVPRSFTPAGAIASIDELAGLRPLVDLPAGTQLTNTLFSSARAATGFRLRRGERAVTVGAAVAPDGAESLPGRVVDLFAAGIGGGTGVEAVVSGAEVLASSENAGSPAETAGPDGGAAGAKRQDSLRLTLRVTTAQAAALIRADAFAEDLRAVLRP